MHSLVEDLVELYEIDNSSDCNIGCSSDSDSESDENSRPSSTPHTQQNIRIKDDNMRNSNWTFKYQKKDPNTKE